MVVTGIEAPPENKRDAFLRFYDPNHLTANFGTLATSLAEKRSTPTNIKTIRGLARYALLEPKQEETRLVGADLVWAEAVHAEIYDESVRQEFAQHTGRKVTELMAIEAEIEADTDAAAETISAYVKEVRGNPELQRRYSVLSSTEISDQTPSLVIAGLLMSLTAHHGQKRQNLDRRTNQPRAYFFHTLAVAMLYQAAWEVTVTQIKDSTDPKINSTEIPSIEDLHLQLFLNLVHDAFEDMIKKDPSISFLASENLLITPLVIKKVLQKLHPRTSEHPKELTSHVKSVTKVRDLEGNAPTNQTYFNNYTAAIRPLHTKVTDSNHNAFIDAFVGPDGEIKNLNKYIANIDQAIQWLKDHLKDEFGVLVLESVNAIARTEEFFQNHEAFMEHLKDMRLGLPRS